MLAQEAIKVDDHQHLVKTIDWTNAKTGSAIVSAKPIGTSIRDKIAYNGPMSWDNLTPIIMQAADALEHGYINGVLHLHLSPDVLYHDERNGLQIQGLGIPQFLKYRQYGSL